MSKGQCSSKEVTDEKLFNFFCGKSNKAHLGRIKALMTEETQTRWEFQVLGC